MNSEGDVDKMNDVFTTEEVLKELGGKKITIFMICFMMTARFEMQFDCYPEDFDIKDNLLLLRQPHDKQLILSKKTKFKKDYLGNFITMEDNCFDQVLPPYITISLEK